MRRIHQMTRAEWDAWKETRMEFGAKKYGEQHKGRYTLVDEMEELFDLMDIHRKGGIDRIYKYVLTLDNQQKRDEIMRANNRITELAEDLKRAIIALDRLLPDEVCTDENTEERIWWD